MSGALSEAWAQVIAVVAWAKHHVALLLVIALAGTLIASEAGRFQAKREASDYRSLWNKERLAHRNALNGRLADLEAQVEALPVQEVPREYKDRLADVRQRFNRIVQRETVAVCPAPVRTAPAPAAASGTDVAPVVTCSPDNADRLAKLQAWVREHMAAYHGVKV